MLQALSVLSRLVHHLPDPKELAACIDTVLPGVVRLVGANEREVSEAAARTIQTFLTVGRDSSR